MNPNDPICAGFTKQVERKDSIAIAMFDRGGNAMQQFLSRNPPADLDMVTSEFGRFCVFLRPDTDVEYMQYLESIADLYLDTVEFKVKRYVTGVFIGMPERADPSYELVYEHLKDDGELRWTIPQPIGSFWNALHRMWCRESKLRQRLTFLGVHPGPETERIEGELLLNDEQKINDAWSYAMRLDKNIRALDAQVKTTESTTRNSKLIHLAKIADQY